MKTKPIVTAIIAAALCLSLLAGCARPIGFAPASDLPVASRDEAAPVDASAAADPAAPASAPADTQQSTGRDAALIGEDEARAIAIAHAGLVEADVTFLRIELDHDDGRTEYEVEFYSGNKEYDYEIDAATGEVIACDNEVESYAPPAQSPQSGDYIDESEARAIALAHAGVTEDDATFTRTKLDHDDGRAEYEVEFYKGNTEYDYDIDAVTGDIISYDHDAEYGNSGDSTGSGADAGSYIGESAAKAAALAHAGLSEGQVTRLTAKLDHDDGRAEYEVEFHIGNTEYSYDIDAVTGSILSHDKDIDDD